MMFAFLNPGTVPELPVSRCTSGNGVLSEKMIPGVPESFFNSQNCFLTPGIICPGRSLILEGKKQFWSLRNQILSGRSDSRSSGIILARSFPFLELKNEFPGSRIILGRKFRFSELKNDSPASRSAPGGKFGFLQLKHHSRALRNVPPAPRAFSSPVFLLLPSVLP